MYTQRNLTTTKSLFFDKVADAALVKHNSTTLSILNSNHGMWGGCDTSLISRVRMYRSGADDLGRRH